MDNRKGIFSSFLSAIRSKKKWVNSVLVVSGDDQLIAALNARPSHYSSSEQLAKANPVFAVSGEERKTLDELIAAWKAQLESNFHSFSSEQLVKATNNFNGHHLVSEEVRYRFYKGAFGRNQPILIKKLKLDCYFPPSEDVESVNIRDTVIASHLSSHGSSLKLIGCCQQLLAQVFEYQGNVKFLSDSLYQRRGGRGETDSLPWRNRLSVAHDVANALVILHDSFSTPVILRDLNPGNILIDQFGAAKLLDFSLCIQVPEGESQVEDCMMGTCGYAEPQYMATGVLTEKTDVFNFGVLLLQLLTGQRAVDAARGRNTLLLEWFEESLKKGQLMKVVDPRMTVDGKISVELEKEYRAFAELAMRCTKLSRKERPQMIDVAAELARIQSATQTN